MMCSWYQADLIFLAYFGGEMDSDLPRPDHETSAVLRGRSPLLRLPPPRLVLLVSLVVDQGFSDVVTLTRVLARNVS